MPRPVVGNTELGGGKLKKGEGFLKPNFGVGPRRAITGGDKGVRARDAGDSNQSGRLSVS